MDLFLFLNFKTYKEATGDNALKLAKTAQIVAKKTGVEIVLAVQAVDLSRIAQSVSLKVFAQHADPITAGAHTGQTLPFALKQAGCAGVVLNHAENKRSDEFIEKTAQIAKNEELAVLVCAETLKRASAISKILPDFIAVETPELIGGNISVSTAKPKLITNSVMQIKKISPKTKVLVGAGIKTKEDAILAVKYGAEGIFVSSGVVLSKEQEKALSDLA
ncbi:MAG: triose-phosphate isomerase, partial [Candidatus Diapherotrites archaeon]|nr:triose-phosphate isomerase [Candidatus Diapherotrites archaeon]